MAIQQPTLTDSQSSPDHSLSHRVFANDSASAVKAVVVDSSNNILLGDGTTNYMQVSSTGFTTLVGSAKSQLAMRPAFVAGKTTTPQKPTPVFYGAYGGYSFPIYNNDNEELFWRLTIPGRWDGSTDIEYKLYVCLAAEETTGDDFRFQLSWSNTTGTTGVINTTTVDVTADGDCSAGHTAAYSVFILTFTIDVSAGPITPVAAGHVLTGRIRRIASGGTEVSDEIIILDHTLDFTVDRIFKAA